MAAPKKKIKKQAPKKRVSAQGGAASGGKKTKKKLTALNLRKSPDNPIIKPSADTPWQSKATFNPTALYHDGKVHIVYRAIGDTDESVLGYASSLDGTPSRIGIQTLFIATQKKGGLKKHYQRFCTAPVVVGVVAARIRG